MNILQVSDDIKNCDCVEYIFEKMNEFGESEFDNKSILKTKRATIRISCGDDVYPYVKRRIDELICEVVCVAYKYVLFDGKVPAAGINSEERELLLSAIIAADFDDDRRYVKSKIADRSEICIDGLFNFCLQKLLKKWEEISGYIPHFFSPEELSEFFRYLINEKKGRKVYIENENVFDSRNRKIERSRLLPKGSVNRLKKDVLLSGAGEVVVINELNSNDLEWINKYFGNKCSKI